LRTARASRTALRQHRAAQELNQRLNELQICSTVHPALPKPARGAGPPDDHLADGSGFLPELTGDFDRIDAGPLPPGLFVTGTMDRTVMRAA
jgi:hypothetical protein